jgi:hypothetical protein
VADPSTMSDRRAVPWDEENQGSQCFAFSLLRKKKKKKKKKKKNKKKKKRKKAPKFLKRCC